MKKISQNTGFAARVFMILVPVFAGCGSGSQPPAPGPTPIVPNIVISGQYNLLLTSKDGQTTTNIYANFTPTGAGFVGAGNTLVCPRNDSSQCKGGGAPGISIVPSGTVKGTNVSIAISFPTGGTSDTVTMVGSATMAGLSGTYSDTLGDSGSWTASVAIYPFGPPGSVYDYAGSFNSTPNPLLIAPTISLELGRDPVTQTASNVAGKATVTNSPCISSLTLSGQAIGDALSLTDTVNNASVLALPNSPGTSSFNFSYKFDSDAPACAGDFGRGTLTINLPGWDY